MNLPNKITLARIAFIPLVFISYLLTWYIVAAILFAMLSATDFIDGHIARSRNLVTKMGAFLDPIADKVLVVAAMFLIAVSNHTNGAELAILFTLAVSRDLIISGFRLIAQSVGTTVSVDKLGKLKTVLLNIALTLLILAPLSKTIRIIGTVILYFATALSLYSGFNYVYKNRSVLSN